MENKIKQLNELQKLGKEWLNKYGNPHQTIMIDVNGICTTSIELFIPDNEVENVSL